MEEVLSRGPSMRSSDRSFNVSEVGENNKMYVAVGKEVEEWIEKYLKCLLKSIHKNTLIVFLHVHQPAKTIQTPLGHIPADLVEKQVLDAYRHLEKMKMNECLNKYVDTCVRNHFNATYESTDNDDIAEGLLKLMNQHRVTNLVIGAGSKMKCSFWPIPKTKKKEPKLKIALTVKQKAELSCWIRIISKGELICIREAQNAPDGSELSRSNSGSSLGFNSPIELYDKSSSSSSSNENLVSETESPTSSSPPPTPPNNSPSALQNEDICTRFEPEQEASGELIQLTEAAQDLVQARQELMKNKEQLKKVKLENALLRQIVRDLIAKDKEKSVIIEKLAKDLKEAQQ